MAFCRQWLLIFCALLLGGGQIRAASAREDRAYAAAGQAFHDQNWERAAAALDDFSQRFPKSERIAEAGLMKAQAEFHQGKFSAAIATLSAHNDVPTSLAATNAYWLAEAQFAQGDYPAAGETWSALAGKFPDSPLALGAVVAAAAAWDKLGNTSQLDALLEATNGVFARTAQLDPDNEMVANGRLLLAHSRNLRADFAGADRVLNGLNPKALKPEQDGKRLSELCQARLGLKDFEGALVATTNLTAVARLQKDAGLRAASEAWRAGALEQLDRLPEAEAAWTENLTATAPAEKQREAVLKLAALALRQNDFTNAAAKLESFLGQFPNSPGTELALLTLGEMQLKDYVSRPAATNQLALAQTNFDRLIATSTNLPLTGKAFLDRGWGKWLMGRTNASLGDFLQAVQQLPPSEDLAVAKFKAGDALFAQSQFAEARTHYQSVLTDFSAWPTVAKSLGAPALYQSLRASLELKDAAAAADAMQRLVAAFPTSELADNSLLLVAEGYSDFGSPTNALRVCRDFERRFPASPLAPQVAFLVARILEQEQDWPAAISSYEDWLKKFPESKARPQVKFALAQAHFHAGEETNAFQLFTAFVTEFPTDNLAPQAQWWVADYFFRATNFAGAGNFVAAETNYENIFQNTNAVWKKSKLFYPAQKMAGLAAMGRLQFSDANAYFAKLLGDTNCLDDRLKTETRFAYGASLRQTPSADTNNPQANLQLATNILSQIWQAYPTNQWGAVAWSETGDCDLQMSDFDAATNAFAQTANAPLADAGLRSRAKVGLGIALEKKAALLPPEAQGVLLKTALDNYCDVLYTTNETADAFWTKAAGLRALPLMRLLEVGDVDRFCASLEHWLPSLTEIVEKKKASLNAVKN